MTRKYDFSDVHAVVVDDDRHMRTIVRMALQACGFGCVTLAAGGREAFEYLTNAQPDLAITDWQMRDGDGIEFVRQVRQSSDSPDRYLPIVLLTGFAHRERVIEARDAGITDMLVKPISAKRIVSRIAAIAEKPRPFVSAPDFFGPCRRRTDHTYDGGERRIRQPRPTAPDAQAATPPSDGAGDLLDFEDAAEPSICQPPNRLGDKAVGPRGDDPMVLIARIEVQLAQLKGQYRSWAKADLARLYEALDAARTHAAERNQHVDEVYELSHNMRGQGGTFGYTLISDIGNSLCAFIEGAKEFGARELEAIRVHAESMQLALTSDLQSDADKAGAALLAQLHAVTDKLTVN